MTDREATMKAYNALHFNLPVIEDYGSKEQLEVQHSAINALDHALAQEQTKCPRCGEVNPAEIHTCSPQVAQPEQEPVAYLCENAVGYKYFRWKKPTSHYKPIALYTAPPPKQWVGLTDDEIDWIFGLAYADDMELLRTIEAKLKDKNG